jgi:SpoVK/Ycf46/Vps4 family AAA+-type ATPase
MQEKTKAVFVVTTANNISKLPPELLRKGRFDEMFFVDLPAESERKSIFSIHRNKNKQIPSNFRIVIPSNKCNTVYIPPYGIRFP